MRFKTIQRGRERGIQIQERKTEKHNNQKKEMKKKEEKMEEEGNTAAQHVRRRLKGRKRPYFMILRGNTHTHTLPHIHTYSSPPAPSHLYVCVLMQY